MVFFSEIHLFYSIFKGPKGYPGPLGLPGEQVSCVCVLSVCLVCVCVCDQDKEFYFARVQQLSLLLMGQMLTFGDIL